MFSRYTAENLIASLKDLSNSIEELLQGDLEKYGIIMMSVSIADIDFTDVFTNALEAKQVAAQEKLTAKTKRQAIMEPKAAAVHEKNAAEVAAEVQRVEAYATRTKAEAAAEANRMILESLTQELIDYQYAKTWNGVRANHHARPGRRFSAECGQRRTGGMTRRRVCMQS